MADCESFSELVLDFCIFHGYNNPIVNEQTLIYNISEKPLKKIKEEGGVWIIIWNASAANSDDDFAFF